MIWKKNGELAIDALNTNLVEPTDEPSDSFHAWTLTYLISTMGPLKSATNGFWLVVDLAACKLTVGNTRNQPFAAIGAVVWRSV